ncbi:MAG: tryptophan 7-halogenase [Colwellia sp.]|nr:tryptophan 7-halogenase [Colwellia sp.]
MSIKHRPLKSYVIVGGGTAGWVSAAVLSHVLQNTGVSITLVESPDVPTVGVGEATIPSFIDLLSFLNISQKDFIAKTNATFKLAIKFVDWFQQGQHYWHPFGKIGSKVDGKEFYQHWLKNHIHGGKFEYTDFSPAVAMAKENRFFIPDPKKPSNLSNSAHALHFDAGLAAKFLAEYAQAKGVKCIKAHVERVEQHENGNIKTLHFKDGQEVSGDFFIDCSGQRSLLLKKSLRVGFVDWQHYLPVNSAVVMQTEKMSILAPYTESTAHDNGWRWRIPLQNRTGNGFVFSQDFCSDQQAIDLLSSQVTEKAINEPRIIRFTTGKMKKFWHKNCLAVGLSSGFLEPLESTGIHLIMKGILNFVQMLPDENLADVTQNEYNRLMDAEYDSIRDFIVLHYCTSKRDDSPFWKMWQHIAIPESLQNKLALFKSQGRLMKNDLDLFASDSWYAVLEGMGVKPNSYDPTVDASNFELIQNILKESEVALKRNVQQLMSHEDYITRILAST